MIPDLLQSLLAIAAIIPLIVFTCGWMNGWGGKL